MIITNIIRTIGRDSVEQAVVSSIREGFETIVVSDGPTESSGILESYSEQIKHIELPSKWGGNGFMCANVAVGMSTGDWIVGLDDDDTFIEGAYEIISNYIRSNPDLDIIIPGLRYNKATTVINNGKIIVSTDACTTPGLFEGNVGMPIYKRSLMYSHPFRTYTNLGLTDFLHVVDCSKDGSLIGWIGQVTHLVRPNLSGVSGSR